MEPGLQGNKKSAIQSLFGTIQVCHLPCKRLFDILFSAFVLIVFSPLYLCIACAIKLFSPEGSVFFAHERIGRGGALFTCYKFRTMYIDSEKRLEKILEEDSERKKEWQQQRKLKNDPRVIPLIGAFLRKSSFDELPQFWNVLIGDLSVVGPRPVVLTELLEHYRDKAPKILSVRPGITCLWQVSGRSNTQYQERVHLDEQYVDTRTFWKDLLLILRTVPAVLLSRGAY